MSGALSPGKSEYLKLAHHVEPAAITFIQLRHSPSNSSELLEGECYPLCAYVT